MRHCESGVICRQHELGGASVSPHKAPPRYRRINKLRDDLRVREKKAPIRRAGVVSERPTTVWAETLTDGSASVRICSEVLEAGLDPAATLRLHKPYHIVLEDFDLGVCCAEF